MSKASDADPGQRYFPSIAMPVWIGENLEPFEYFVHVTELKYAEAATAS